jgi:hypothetical protein
MALPAMATAWFFSDVQLRALNDFVVGGVCLGIITGFLFAVSGMSVWSAKSARLKVAASLLGLFLVMFVVVGYLLNNPGWSFWGYLVLVCSALTAGLFTAFIIFLKPTPA